MRGLRVLLKGVWMMILPAALPAFAASPPGGAQDCAAIAADAERLACFDKLYGHPGAPGAAGAPATPAGPAPSRGSPAAAAAPKGAAQALAPPPAAAPQPTDKESFGLYAAEHPTTPALSVESVSGHVIAFGNRTNGKRTLVLEGGGVWELIQDDPVLAVGDLVTIRRAALGSFLLTTPGKRVHRVRRLQ